MSDKSVYTNHPSNPDMLAAKMLGVCWHSPTSDRWPCGNLQSPKPCNTCKDTGRVMWRIDSGEDAGMRQWGDCPDCKGS